MSPESPPTWNTDDNKLIVTHNFFLKVNIGGGGGGVSISCVHIEKAPYIFLSDANTENLKRLYCSKMG